MARKEPARRRYKVAKKAARTNVRNLVNKKPGRNGDYL